MKSLDIKKNCLVANLVSLPSALNYPCFVRLALCTAMVSEELKSPYITNVSGHRNVTQ